MPITGTFGEKDVVLERFQLLATTYISPELAKEFAEPCTVDISTHVNWLFDQIVLRVVQPMWGEKLDEISVRYPADWREALKERFAPQWALARWPVRYRTHTMTAKALYPRISLPEEEWKFCLSETERHE